MQTHLMLMKRNDESEYDACERVSIEWKRILTIPEMEELTGLKKNVIKDIRHDIIKKFPELPKYERGDAKKHDMEHENKGYQKRKCIGPGSDGLGCRKIFSSEGFHNRICTDCKESTLFNGIDEGCSFGRKSR